MGLTDKHLAYGDDIPQTQAEKDYYWKIKHLEEQNNKLKEALQKALDNSKTGRWIYKDLKGQFCSACDKQSVWKFNYCPNCGAKMVESEDVDANS